MVETSDHSITETDDSHEILYSFMLTDNANDEGRPIKFDFWTECKELPTFWTWYMKLEKDIDTGIISSLFTLKRVDSAEKPVFAQVWINSYEGSERICSESFAVDLEPDQELKGNVDHIAHFPSSKNSVDFGFSLRIRIIISDCHSESSDDTALSTDCANSESIP